jgi:hypothetical protein
MRFTSDCASFRCWRLALAGLALGCLPLSAGCSRPEPIREYVVLKPPAPGSLWFFKLMGPQDKVAAASASLRSFLDSVTFDQNGQPSWKLPDGWTEESPGNAVRYKTLKLPGDSGLEIAVTQIGGKVPLSADDARLQANMLREQVGLEPEPATSESAAGGEPPGDALSMGGRPARLFDFEGETNRYGATRLIAAMVAVPTPPSSASPVEEGLPFTYTAPPDWRDAPHTQFSVVSMEAGAGEETASMTITPAMGGVLANVNRWRSQAGLSAVEEAELPELLEPIEAEGITLLYTSVTGAKRAILGAVAATKSGTWFIKLDGPPRLVKDEQARFRAFLESFRLSGE